MFSNNTSKQNKPKPNRFNTTFNYDLTSDSLVITDKPIKEGQIAPPETLGAIHALMVYVKMMSEFSPEQQTILAKSLRFDHKVITNADYESCELEITGMYSIYSLLLHIQKFGRDQKQEPQLSLWANLAHQGAYTAFVEKYKNELGLGEKEQRIEDNETNRNRRF